MRVLVALTGGIGAGKSTVSRLLAEHGAVVIDADQLARLVVEPGSPALAAIAERFGGGVLRDGALDRPALSAIVFDDEDARRDLEAITHPAIGDEFRRRLETVPEAKIVVYDVPLLAESSPHAPANFDAVVVVEAPIEVRLARLEQRGMDRDDAMRRMASQSGDEERRRLATHVLDNRGGVAELARQVDTLWDALERLSVSSSEDSEDREDRGSMS